MDDHYGGYSEDDSGLYYPKVLYPYFPGYEDYRQEHLYTSDENDRSNESDATYSTTSSSSATSSASSTRYKYKYKYKYKYGKTSTSENPGKYTDDSSSSSSYSSCSSSEQTPPRDNHLPAAYPPPVSYPDTSYLPPPLYPKQEYVVPPHQQSSSSTPRQYKREKETKKFTAEKHNKKEQNGKQEDRKRKENRDKGRKEQTERRRTKHWRQTKYNLVRKAPSLPEQRSTNAAPVCRRCCRTGTGCLCSTNTFTSHLGYSQLLSNCYPVYYSPIPESNLQEAPTQYTSLHLQWWLPKRQPPRLVTLATSLLSRSSSCRAAWPSYSLLLPPFVRPDDARDYSSSSPRSNLVYYQPLPLLYVV